MSEKNENKFERDIKTNRTLTIIAIMIGSISVIYYALVSRKNHYENYVSKKFVEENYISKKEHEEQLIHIMDLIYSDTTLLNGKEMVSDY